ncbi:SDR family NAD(P)-dependent oxidoreductase [Streptomyces sp. NPDC002018]|uniref:SDR family NAD(P)-dependent oxidoreductase n=1 Tax=Streptomyces sp. NPDC002018 TaxID=3364629 RepID=UPI00368DA6F9
MRRFTGKVALVTGAGSGIGAATAEQLAREGAAVALVGRRPGVLKEVAVRIREAGGRALEIPADVSDAEQVRAAVEATVTEWGALHLAVNNAAVSGGNSELVDLGVEDWNATVAVNLSAVFYGLKYQIPAITAAGGGAIVNVSSVYGDRGLTHYAAYTASKHGVRGLTRSAAVDYAERGVRINELQPGVIATPMSATDPESTRTIEQGIPARRAGLPAETAEAVCFLLSDAASYITGTHFSVDGGLLA